MDDEKLQGDNFMTPPETPSAKARVAAAAADPLPPLPPPSLPKPELTRSELWTTVFTVIGTLATGFATTGPAGKFIALVTLLGTVATYTYYRTPLPSAHPGWKTPAFFGSALSIVGSIALAISEANLPYLPEGATKIGALVAAGVTAAGYTVYRYSVKAVAKK